MKEKAPICFKIAFVGEAQAGKTQIVRRFVLNQFSPAYQTAFTNLEIKTFMDSQGRCFKVHIWDAGGQSQARAIPYIKTVNVVGIVMDGSCAFDASKLSAWLEHVKKATAEPVSICCIVNKIDGIEAFDDAYQTTLNQQLHAVLKEHGYDPKDVPIFYCSAKTGQGIQELFDTLAAGLVEHPLAAAHPKEAPHQTQPAQEALSEPTEIPETTQPVAPLSTFWDKVGDTLSQHKFLAGGNGLLLLGMIILLLVATAIGGGLTLGLPLSVMAVSLIVLGAAIVLWNVGCWIGNQCLKHGNSDAREDLKPDQPFSCLAPLFLPNVPEMTKPPLQEEGSASPQTQNLLSIMNYNL